MTAAILTNTLGGNLEEFEPIETGHVRMYSCGPTVYGPAHVGNFRAFLLGDLTRRYLEWSGYRVTWVMNITDVDDRIIRDLQAAGGTLDELTAPHIARFKADMEDLRVGPPTHLTRATRPHPRDGAADRHAAREGPRIPNGRWLDLLPHLVVAGVRDAGQARSARGTRRRARRGRRLRQGRRS